MNRCQVCGKKISDRLLNCGIHSYVRQSMIPLAQEIWRLNDSPSSTVVSMLAEKYKCHESTVRNHLKRQGFNPVRGWKKKKEDK